MNEIYVIQLTFSTKYPKGIKSSKNLFLHKIIVF